MKKAIFFDTVFICSLILLVYFLIHTVRAGLVSNFSDQLSTHAISTAANHTISFRNSSNFGPNKTIELFFEDDFDLSQIDYTDIDFKDDEVDLNLGATPGIGSGSNIGVMVNNQTITFTQNDTDTVLANSVITIDIGLNADYQLQGDKQIYNPSIPGTYKVSLGGTFGDYGTISLAILNNDAVYLQAEIVPELSFNLRNSSDSDTFNFCSLGTISSFGISECSYRLAAETNANSGFQIFIRTDGNLRNEINYIANVAEDSQVTQGIEGYGIALTAGTGINEEGDFTDDDTPLSTVETLLLTTNSVYNYIQGNLNTSTLITHKASVSEQTKAGIYSQQVIYSILANY